MKFSNLRSWKVLNTYVFFAYLFAIFEILSGQPQLWFLVVLKCYSQESQSYEICIFYPLVDVSIGFSPLLDSNLKVLSEVDIHFVLFEFAVVLLWETMTVDWIIWWLHNGDPMVTTLLKYNFLNAYSFTIFNLFLSMSLLWHFIIVILFFKSL